MEDTRDRGRGEEAAEAVDEAAAEMVMAGEGALGAARTGDLVPIGDILPAVLASIYARHRRVRGLG